MAGPPVWCQSLPASVNDVPSQLSRMGLPHTPSVAAVGCPITKRRNERAPNARSFPFVRRNVFRSVGRALLGRTTQSSCANDSRRAERRRRKEHRRGGLSIASRSRCRQGGRGRREARAARSVAVARAAIGSHRAGLAIGHTFIHRDTDTKRRRTGPTAAFRAIGAWIPVRDALIHRHADAQGREHAPPQHSLPSVHGSPSATHSSMVTQTPRETEQASEQHSVPAAHVLRRPDIAPPHSRQRGSSRGRPAFRLRQSP